MENLSPIMDNQDIMTKEYLDSEEEPIARLNIATSNMSDIVTALTRELRKYSVTITGDGINTDYMISLPTELVDEDCVIQLYDSNNDMILVDVRKTTNFVTVGFDRVVPTSESYKLVVIG